MVFHIGVTGDVVVERNVSLALTVDPHRLLAQRAPEGEPDVVFAAGGVAWKDQSVACEVRWAVGDESAERSARHDKSVSHQDVERLVKRTGAYAVALQHLTAGRQLVASGELAMDNPPPPVGKHRGTFFGNPRVHRSANNMV